LAENSASQVGLAHSEGKGKRIKEIVIDLDVVFFAFRFQDVARDET